MMYRLLRFFLFLFEPELVHALSLQCLRWFSRSFFVQPKTTIPLEVMGLTFPHRIGLAAGLDKNAAFLDALSKLGFAFIEVGTITPKPQSGNPKPRLFRLPKAQALINRMGFNNQGVDALIRHIQQADYQGILGINIGKNKETPLDQAVDDYVYCLQRVYPYASYVTINISSPNTPDLRQLHQADYFEHLIQKLQTARQHLEIEYGRRVPLVVKLSPDESLPILKHMVDVMIKYGIDGLIATNTTCDRDAVKHLSHGHEAGGLSGAPLRHRATETVKILKSLVGDKLVLIGAGGIDSPEAAQEKLVAGAVLLQIYTGLIYQGPGLIRRLTALS